MTLQHVVSAAWGIGIDLVLAENYKPRRRVASSGILGDFKRRVEIQEMV
jgi:hypothetical protein